MTIPRYTPARVVRALGRRVYSAVPSSLVMIRDLEAPLEPPRAKLPVAVRPATPDDAPAILERISELAGYDRSNRELFLQAGIGTCYVAVTERDEVCYMQWLIGPDHNALLAEHTRLPALQDSEALLENAFTPAAFRGQGIMSAAMAQIAARASALGARWVLTVVAEPNLASIKGCIRAGFQPHMLKLDRWRMLRHQVRYTALPPGYEPPTN
jgi:RimJ/RimL family protein N-acetyltransferase